jgi:hypothetical protein
LTQKLKCVMTSINECFSKNKAFTQKMKWMMKSVNECFSKNEALTQKSKCMIKSVFIYMFISNRKAFCLRQNANVMKIWIMFSTTMKIFLRMKNKYEV